MLGYVDYPADLCCWLVSFMGTYVSLGWLFLVLNRFFVHGVLSGLASASRLGLAITTVFLFLTATVGRRGRVSCVWMLKTSYRRTTNRWDRKKRCYRVASIIVWRLCVDFGAARFYVNCAIQVIRNRIDIARAESLRTCEIFR